MRVRLRDADPGDWAGRCRPKALLFAAGPQSFKAGAIFGPQPDALGLPCLAVGTRFDTDAVGAGDVEAGQREADGHDGDGFG